MANEDQQMEDTSIPNNISSTPRARSHMPTQAAPEVPPSFTFPSIENVVAWKIDLRVPALNPDTRNIKRYSTRDERIAKALATCTANEGHYPATSYNMEYILKNVPTVQHDPILKDVDEDRIRFIIPMDAGERWERNTNVLRWMTRVQEYLTPLAEACEGDINVRTPIGTRMSKSQFKNQPEVFTVYVEGEKLKECLDRQAIFAFDSETAFRIVKGDRTTRSWTLGIWQAPTAIKKRMAHDLEGTEVLKYITMSTLFRNRDFRNIVSEAMFASEDSLDGKTLKVLKNLYVEKLIHPAEANAINHHYIIYCEPFTENVKLWERARILVSNLVFEDKLARITPTIRRNDSNRRLGCSFCKVETHLRFDCHAIRANKDYQGPRVIANEMDHTFDSADDDGSV